MDNRNVRIPKQKRSIEKKKRIIEAAYCIFMKDGYFSTNTAEIAKEAGLSTGSVYAYFNDKKDILLVCLNHFGDNLTKEICREIGGLSSTGDIFSTIKNVLQIFVKSHNKQKLVHDEVMSLQYRDDDVKNYFANVQKSMMAAVTKQLEESGYTFRHEREQTFLLFQMVKGIEDELAFDHSPDINQEILIDECARTIISMLIKKESPQS